MATHEGRPVAPAPGARQSPANWKEARAQARSCSWRPETGLGFDVIFGASKLTRHEAGASAAATPASAPGTAPSASPSSASP
jgi:hypothetical protein